MSSLDLHEFNILSKKHNYFLTNNRKHGFPSIKENSIFLQKILLNKSSNSNDKIIEYKGNKPKKIIRFEKKETKLKNDKPSLIKVKRNPYTTNKIYNNQKYQINLYNKESIHTISPYKNNSKSISNNDSTEEIIYKIPINLQYKLSNTPNLYKPPPGIFSNSNINDSENEMTILNHKGKKIFNRNNILFTPIKKENRTKITELYRNSEELSKIKEKVYERKIKRESSAIKRELLRKEKEKNLKNEKLNNVIESINNSINNEKSKNKYINRVKNIKQNNINSNNIKLGYKTNENNQNILYNKNSSNMNIFNKNSIFDSIQSNDATKIRINKYKINRNNINNTIHLKGINTNLNEKNVNQRNMDNIKYNSNSTTNFKTNNIYLSQDVEHSPPKIIRSININHKIKENLNYLRKRKVPFQNMNYTFNKTISSIDKHNNPYSFSISNKKFIEDYTYEPPIIFSEDKKVSIKVHTLQNMNEIFLGKKMTREKLRLQRIISLFFEKDNKKKFNYFRNNVPKKIDEYKSIPSKKKEEKFLSNQFKSNLIKKESEIEQKEKSIFQKKNYKIKYINRIQNKK